MLFRLPVDVAIVTLAGTVAVQPQGQDYNKKGRDDRGYRAETVMLAKRSGIPVHIPGGSHNHVNTLSLAGALPPGIWRGACRAGGEDDIFFAPYGG